MQNIRYISARKIKYISASYVGNQQNINLTFFMKDARNYDFKYTRRKSVILSFIEQYKQIDCCGYATHQCQVS